MRFIHAQKHRHQDFSTAAKFLSSLATTPVLTGIEPVGPPNSFGFRIGPVAPGVKQRSPGPIEPERNDGRTLPGS